MSIANKTREEALKTRRLIIDTATAVILKKGYERATLLDIAAQTGMTRGAVYGNFKNKSELFECILSDWTLPETLANALTSELPLSRTCCDTLQSLEKDGLYQIVLSLATGSAAEQEDAVPEKSRAAELPKAARPFRKDPSDRAAEGRRLKKTKRQRGRRGAALLSGGTGKDLARRKKQLLAERMGTGLRRYFSARAARKSLAPPAASGH
ncbi:MAG: TetR family transcriptional regulator, partial [Pyramidobacter sp.]|nr:TetR family transcriptional regulator [Pyramidobacter sp.]